MQKIIFQIFLFIFSSHFLFSQDTTEVSQENIFSQTDSLSLQNISQDSTKISDSLGLPIIVNESKNELSELSKIIDPEGYRGMHWGMSLNEVKSFIVTLDSTVRENNFSQSQMDLNTKKFPMRAQQFLINLIMTDFILSELN